MVRELGRRLRFVRRVILPVIDSEIVGMTMIGALALSIGVVLRSSHIRNNEIRTAAMPNHIRLSALAHPRLGASMIA